MSIQQSFENLCSVLKDKLGAKLDVTTFNTSAVVYNAAQSLTADQKAQARANIGVSSAEELTEYKIVKEATAESGYSATYKVYKSTDSGKTYAVDTNSAAINIPKDLVVESGSVKTCTQADTPVTGYKVGDKYIDLVLANATDQHIYILVSDLIDVYTAEQGATSVQLVISDDNVISATVVDGAISTAKIADGAVVTDKINDSAVTTAKINNAAVTADKIDANAVTTDKINAGAVTTAKIADNAVTTAKIDFTGFKSEDYLSDDFDSVDYIKSSISAASIDFNTSDMYSIPSDHVDFTDSDLDGQYIADGSISRAKIDEDFEADIAALETAVSATITVEEFEGLLA